MKNNALRIKHLTLKKKNAVKKALGDIDETIDVSQTVYFVILQVQNMQTKVKICPCYRQYFVNYKGAHLEKIVSDPFIWFYGQCIQLNLDTLFHPILVQTDQMIYLFYCILFYCIIIYNKVKCLLSFLILITFLAKKKKVEFLDKILQKQIEHSCKLCIQKTKAFTDFYRYLSKLRILILQLNKLQNYLLK